MPALPLLHPLDEDQNNVHTPWFWRTCDRDPTAYLQSAKRPNAEYAALAFVRGDLCFDLSQYIPDLTVPTAMIWGKGTEFTQPSLGRRLAEMNPQAIRHFEHLDDVGYTPQLEQPAVTIGLIRKLLPLLA